MRIQTFSILAGSEACNASCPFCVSSMTPPLGVELKAPEVNWRNFEVACQLAKQSGVTTAMFTGKGEPTLFPDQITDYLARMSPHKFPLIEIQTNGIKLFEQNEKYLRFLKLWYGLGMTTIAVSIVHFEPEMNRRVYLPERKEYIDLPALIAMLHALKFSVRLTCIGAMGYIDGPSKLRQLVEFAKANKVEQLTFTPVNKPEVSQNDKVWEWANEHHLNPVQQALIRDFVEGNGHRLMTLAHGAVVYDLFGQNLCLNECLTIQPEATEMRNLIFFPDGRLQYYWQYEGARIL